MCSFCSEYVPSTTRSTVCHQSSFVPSLSVREYVRRYTNSPSGGYPKGGFFPLYLSRKDSSNAKGKPY